ncbi:MAG: hypothetical protein EOM06_09595 [Sphingobacteriia bacterium]|nr:hypothetical protein [Sphingobacteriia bacterium]
MNEQYIALLRKQIEKLETKNFDLNAWKAHTAILLGRIFGEDSQKVRQIEKIEYEFNSWSLRDTTGYSEYLDSCKKLGREVLEASISELDLLGLPQNINETGKINPAVVLDALNDELKGSQFRQLLRALQADSNAEEKRRQVDEIIREMGETSTRKILGNILLNSSFIENIPG